MYTVRWGTPQAGGFDGKAVLASGSFDRTVKLWDAEGGTCLQTLCGHEAVRQLGVAHACVRRRACFLRGEGVRRTVLPPAPDRRLGLRKGGGGESATSPLLS